jgi:hypothetical protein
MKNGLINKFIYNIYVFLNICDGTNVSSKQKNKKKYMLILINIGGVMNIYCNLLQTLG